MQLHLELDKNLSLEEAHTIANDVEAGIKALIALVEVIIHQHPVDVLS